MQFISVFHSLPRFMFQQFFILFSSFSFFFVLECEIHFLKGVRERHVVISLLKTAENCTNKMTVALVHFILTLFLVNINNHLFVLYHYHISLFLSYDLGIIIIFFLLRKMSKFEVIYDI